MSPLSYSLNNVFRIVHGGRRYHSDNPVRPALSLGTSEDGNEGEQMGVTAGDIITLLKNRFNLLGIIEKPIFVDVLI